MSQNPQNPFSLWAGMSKNMFDAWQSYLGGPIRQTEGSDKNEGGGYVNPFTAYYEFFEKGLAPFLSDTAGEKNGDFINLLYSQWQEGVKGLSALITNQSVKDGFDRFMNSFQLFNGLQPVWEMFYKNMPKDITDWDSFAQTVMQSYQNMSANFVSMLMPDHIKSFFALPIDNINALQQILVSIYRPWVEDSGQLQSHLMKALAGDRGEYTEFLKALAEIYKNSFSKLLHMPAVGINHTHIEKLMKLVDYYVNYAIAMDEFSSKMSDMMNDAMKKLLEHMSELQQKGETPQTFMDFYKLWSKINEQAFMDMYATDDFAKLMNEAVSTGSKLQILYDDYMQDVLAFLPLPNRRELDDVEKELYNLRKQVKAQEKELKKLKELFDAKQ